MCCGCQRIMGPDGKPGEKLFRGGLVQWWNRHAVSVTPLESAAAAQAVTTFQPLAVPIEVSPPESSKFASFPDKAAADAAATAAGWQTADADGPNHRCPECLSEERLAAVGLAQYNRGAYIEVELLDE